MAKVEHRNLTGASLHEPKGVSGASSDTVYVADGAGSGAWSDPFSDVNNKNLLVMTAEIEDINSGTAATRSCFVPCPLAGKVTKVSVFCESNFTTTNAVLTGKVVSAGTAFGAGTATDLSLTLTHSQGVNAVFQDTVTSNNTLTTSQGLYIQSDGAGTGACKAIVVITLDVT
jgi:hypothetical protein